MKKYISFALLLFTLVCIFLPTSHVEARTVSIGTVTPNTTVSVGTTISFNITSDDYVRLTYTISDSLAGSTISNSSINTVGTFSWTPLETDIGVHNLVITAIDPLGVKSTHYQTLTVTQASAVNIVAVSPGPSVFPNNGVSFGVSALGYVNPTFSLSDSFSGSSITARNIDSFGNVNWTPKESDVGIHNLAVRVYGLGGRQDTVYQTITVNGVSMKEPSRTNDSSVASAVAYVGTTFNFSTNLYGLTYPTYSLSDSLGNSTLDSTAINVNNFSWKPEPQDIGRHVITITASDGTNVSKTQLIVNVQSKTIANTSATNSTNSNISTVVSPTVNAKSTSSTSNVESYVFKKALSVGSKGSEVIELQKRLKAEGLYSGPINGSFGPLTKAAVIKFQGAHGIAKLGSVGPATRVTLNKR